MSHLPQWRQNPINIHKIHLEKWFLINWVTDPFENLMKAEYPILSGEKCSQENSRGLTDLHSPAP